MRKPVSEGIVILSLFLSGLNNAMAQPGKSSRNEMAWWYDRPASKYWESMPVGTGRFAAMIPGGIGREKICLNEETLWSGGPNNPNNPDGPALLKEMRQLILNGNYLKADSISTAFNSIPMRVQHYQPMGNLNIIFDNHDESMAEDYRRKLSMDSSLVSVSYNINGISYRREVFASYPDQVIVMKITAGKPGAISFTCWMDSPQPSAVSLLEKGDIVLRGGTADLTQETYSARLIPGKIKWQAKVRISQKGGKISGTRIAGSGNIPALRVTNASSVTFIIAGATNWVNWNDVSADEKARCNEYINAASLTKYENLRKRHLDDYMQLFGSCRIDLGAGKNSDLSTTERMELMRKGEEDPMFVSQYFQYGRYLLLAGARENTLAFNNHNMWLDNMEGRWQGRWTLNINIQECYWPVESTGLSVLNESLLLFTENLAAAGRRTAREMFGCRGWVAHHGTDVWFNTAPTDGHPNASMWPMGGVWIMQQLYDHYLYNPDREYLRRIYPLMRGSAEFILDYLIADPETGWMVTCPSSSPENWFKIGNQPRMALSKASAMDIQLTRNLLRNTVSAASALGRDQGMIDSMNNVLLKLPPHQIGKFGQLQEWFYDFDESDPRHRHLSHLFALYPDDDITVYRNPDLAKAAGRVLERKDDRYLGWSGAWKINLYARLLKPEQAYEVLKRMLVDVSIHPREEDSKITPSFEGNQAIQGVTAGIVEMIMQSHSGEISILPALPEAWDSGSIIGLRARGGYDIDISWENGRLRESLITPSADGICRLRTSESVKVFSGGQMVSTEQVMPGLTEFQAAAGKKYIIFPVNR